MATATTGRTKGPTTTDLLKDRASLAIAQLSETGRTTFVTATTSLRRERWFAEALDSERYFLLPDPGICARYRGYTEYNPSPVPGATHAKNQVAIVHLCASTIEAGNAQDLEALMAHELSHGLEKEIAGEPTAKLVTQPILAEIAKQLAEAPEFKGQEDAIRQYLFEKRGGYPQAEMFAVLQSVPQNARLQKNDQLLVTLVCELRRMDASRLPEDVRARLIEDLKFRTTFFYDERIHESQGAPAKSLELARQLAMLTLEQALALREIERTENGSPYDIKCRM